MSILKFRKVYASHGSGQTFKSDATRYDPYKAFRFTMDITGKNMTFGKAGFHKITGLKMKTDVIEYREGGDDVTVIKTPGLVKFEPITCDRGMSDDMDMFSWAVKSYNRVDDTSSNDADCRASLSINLMDRDGKAVRRWDVLSGWISDYETGDFDAQGNNVMIEKMVVQHDGWKCTSLV